MQYFIAINGKVYANKPANRWIPRLQVENNLFDRRDDAHYEAYRLEEYKPMIYYGKPTTKDGLLAYARGDSTAAYKTRT